jgi:hypothetical protein
MMYIKQILTTGVLQDIIKIPNSSIRIGLRFQGVRILQFRFQVEME